MATMTMTTTTDTMLSTGTSPVWIAVGESATATTKRISCAAMLPTSASSPPAATADAMSMPWSCKNRTWAASPPTAGTARFENDIESWSSAVRTSGRFMGTHPMSGPRSRSW